MAEEPRSTGALGPQRLVLDFVRRHPASQSVSHPLPIIQPVYPGSSSRTRLLERPHPHTLSSRSGPQDSPISAVGWAPARHTVGSFREPRPTTPRHRAETDPHTSAPGSRLYRSRGRSSSPSAPQPPGPPDEDHEPGRDRSARGANRYGAWPVGPERAAVELAFQSQIAMPLRSLARRARKSADQGQHHPERVRAATEPGPGARKSTAVRASAGGRRSRYGAWRGARKSPWRSWSAGTSSCRYGARPAGPGRAASFPALHSG